MRNSTNLTTLRALGKPLAVAAIALGIAGAAHAQKLYKWVDEDGNIHYSDQVPPEQVDLARQRLNSQGVVVDDVSRAKTQEEIAAEVAALAAELEEMARQAEQERADRKLLSIYASEEDIVRARDQRLTSLDRSIDASSAYVEGLRKNLAQLLERASNNESQGRAISEALQSSINQQQDQIAQQQAFIDQKTAEKRDITQFYDNELVRFRAVVARRQGG